MLAELDPEVYVIDCLPNMDLPDVDERLRYLLNVLKQKRPDTPVVLVGHGGSQSAFTRANVPKPPKSAALEKVYKDYKKAWGGKLYFVNGRFLVGRDGEGTVDGSHATDLGFYRMADGLTPVIRKLLPAYGRP